VNPLSLLLIPAIVLLLTLANSFPLKSEQQNTSVPEWAKHVVWYQIFPERFRNGDTTNDPKVEDQIGAWPHQLAAGWKISEWTGDWYAQQSWEKQDGKGFYFHVQQRRYGGDLQGVIDKLDYLKDLGIGAIYFNPIFQSPSLHKYDATFYHHVDKNFGPDPDGDQKIWAEENPADPSTWRWTSADKLFLKLLQEAHKRDIKVIIDGVFNHVGRTFWAFEDLRKNQAASKYKDWFTVKKWDNPHTPQNEFDYVGWNGVRELPQLREDENGIVHGPREYIHASIKRWMDPNGDGNPSDGIDGWRLDAAEKVKPAFWRTFRKWVRAINPNAYVSGEVWWEDWNKGIMYNAAPWLQGDMFDAVMNYRWARDAALYFAGEKTKITASEYTHRLQRLLHEYPSESNFVLMNLFDSHDTDRLGSHIVNGDLSFDKNVGLADNKNYVVRKPNEGELAKQKLMVLFQMTYLGAPMVYYGDEAGMWGGDDPDCRKPMLWQDLNYQDERSQPFGTPRPDDKNVFKPDLFHWYKITIQLRNDHQALQTGRCDFLSSDDAKDVFAFARYNDKESVLVILNNSTAQQQFVLHLPKQFQNREWKNLLESGGTVQCVDKLTVTLGPKSGKVFGN
jgi:cyclomaltodextrinase